ncbi:inheritance of peroxisomes protein 1-domain-containing protein [Nemania sp. FL0031]|nr:inheritance of peroxisomes protein 1-domain-containing protein [Nemania sp. FL0031]
MDAPRSASARLDIPRPRRVATAPVSVSAPSQRPTTPSSISSSSSQVSPAAAPEELVETLYNHPAVRIISFTSSRHGFTTFTPDNDVQPGSIPPSSQLERTIAVGAFCIYRAPGSVAFLSCGSALQPILPRSQCWCIDEDNSRFVLQIRRPQYWRIEVPVADPDDALRAELLRDVFDKILLFEKTECPFQRSFTVQLPDPPETPVKKKAWTAEGKNLLSSPFQSDLSPPAHAPMAISRGKRTTNIPREIYSLANFESAVRNVRLEQQEERSEEEEEDQTTGKVESMIEVHENRAALSAMSLVVPHPAVGFRDFTALSDNTSTPPGATIVKARDDYSLSDQRNNGSLDSLDSDHSGSEDNPASFEGSGGVAPINLARKRRTRMLAGRSFTAPPQLTLVTPPPSKSDKQVTVNKTILPQPQPSRASFHSPSASTDSFHSVQSWHSSMSPPDLTKPESDELLESSSQVNYSSDHTTTPRNSVKVVPSSLVVPDSCGSAEPTPRPAEFITNKQPEESNNTESEPRASRLSAFENKLQTRPRSHTGTLRRRALSPLPPAANLFSPPRRQTSQSRLAAIRRLPSVIIQKTIEILLSPPSYLLQLILKVAAMIVAGEWRGLVFGFSDAGEQIPVEWDYYSDAEFSDLSDSDDYTLTAHGSNYGDNVPRTNVRRRTRYTRNDDHDNCEVD